MNQDPISDRERVEFLQNIQQLLTEGGFTATYKYALLHAIADLCIETLPSKDGTLAISVDRIAEKFIDLYWPQVRHFPAMNAPEDYVLRQNAGKQATVINALRELHRPYESRLPSLKSDRDKWAAAVKQVGKTIKTMPLWKLQTIGNRPVEFLYKNDPGADHITLLPGVAHCFRSFYGLVIELARGGWARFVRRHNREVCDGVELYTFLFGSERVNLDGFRNVLRQVEESRCFYCERAIAGQPHVDHFVPWARHPSDLGHNFVLTDAGCNRSKSDFLAAEEHLARWMERTLQKGDVLAEAFELNRLAHDRQASTRIAHWAYGQLAAVQGNVWVAGETFRPLGRTWESRF